MERGPGAALKGPLINRTVAAAVLFSLPVWAGATAAADRPGGPAQEPQTQQEPALRPPLPRGKKLMLKDGTYQLVREYEVRGQRVRFFSVERSTWEELPAELVDWEATRQAEAEEAQRLAELERAAEEAKTARLAAALDVDSSIEVAPGVFLPEGEGAFVVEGAAIRPLAQNLAQVRLDKGRLLTQILVPLPTIPTRHRIELPGPRAELRVAAELPEFYMRTADKREPRLELVRAEVKKDRRRLQAIDTNIIQEQWRDRNVVPLTLWQVARGVYRFTLTAPLEPGEYALVEIMSENEINAYVWDFGVDSSDPSSQKTKDGKKN